MATDEGRALVEVNVALLLGLGTCFPAEVPVNADADDANDIVAAGTLLEEVERDGVLVAGATLVREVTKVGAGGAGTEAEAEEIDAVEVREILTGADTGAGTAAMGAVTRGTPAWRSRGRGSKGKGTDEGSEEGMTSNIGSGSGCASGGVDGDASGDSRTSLSSSSSSAVAASSSSSSTSSSASTTSSLSWSSSPLSA